MARDLASKEIISQKLEQATGELKAMGADLWVTFVQETSSGAERVFSYISPGNLTWESAILVRPSGERTVICGKFDQQDFEESGLFTKVITFVQDFKEPFLDYLRKETPRKVAVNFSLNDPSADGIPHGRFLQLESMLRQVSPDVEIVSAEPIIAALISKKSPLELAAIQEAVDHTVAIFQEIHAFLKPGKTEKEVYDFINGRIKARGLTPSFETLVFAGDRGAGMGHGTAGDNPLKPGDLVHVDMGVFVRGYASDMQRTWYILKPGETSPPEPAKRGFAVIAEAIEKSRAALKPGVKGVDIDAISRGHITGAGFPEYPHALGHQVGRNVHDGGALLGPAWARYRNTPFTPVEEGMIFTLEPSLSVEGFGAVGIEEDVLVTPSGGKFLAPPQRELWTIGGAVRS
ncbi:MAG: aminopeptidase P family protein [Acidobacteria bacterium]|jgi:Xaa-Pro aminopeptidase|nr:aminopeptidase P family protein [Acidobacteriota bacterium]